MALVHRRRSPNLRLPEIADHRPRFPVPLPGNIYKHPSSSSSASVASGDTLSPGDLEKLSVLGHGNGGTVYKVRHKVTSSIYALKVNHNDSDPTTRRRTLAEINILRRAADCPNIVKYHGSFEKPTGDISIVMEFMDSGSLETDLKTNGTFSESKLSRAARDVLNGLAYLHARNIAHRDIKPSNILVNNKNEVKIADFGVSKLMGRTLEACNSYVGTCAYMSPERFDPEVYGGNYNGFSADIWSLGLTLFELYVGHFPFLQSGQRPDWATLMCAICFSDPPSLPETASSEFRNFVECCLKKESGERWTAAQLLTHPFLCKDMDVC
ncbi:mitogen-activated protein kinase kinase 5-like protein [Trifolium pratense]|uniref:mitogen-activated protein kinase kinase n=1 Tax=Trifolium pratense TaxID=57577 RepID=A0A2K3L7S2_TRIPR|nr:mitogen-activated protein kinase kinase 5-like protein [Trifolium pratense]